MVYAIPAIAIALVWLTIIILNETISLLSCDHFPSKAVKWIAYIWLGIFLIGLTVLVTGSALEPGTPEQLRAMPFYSLFSLHAVLVVFLVGWWAMTGMPDLREFLQIRYEKPTEVLAIGASVGIGGWIFTIVATLILVLILRTVGVVDQPPDPPAMIGVMATMAWWKKALLVLSAMTIEEFFFRSFLQKRIGLIASTLLFAIAHSGFGNPLFLIGVSVISLIIGITFYRTKNVVPGILAHGIFDAVQLFVIVPFAFKMMGGA